MVGRIGRVLAGEALETGIRRAEKLGEPRTGSKHGVVIGVEYGVPVAGLIRHSGQFFAEFWAVCAGIPSVKGIVNDYIHDGYQHALNYVEQLRVRDAYFSCCH